jgi:UDP-N-acetylglucosamine 2-epimerase (non-hydrolysing)/GDP/UDP-N,N'-diacetylbacillosamine 2-epimerase (hydrolysing)
LGDVFLRQIGVVTVGRSDYGIYTSVLRRIASHRDLQLRILATGAHLSPEFGHTVDLIAADGFDVDERITMLLSADTPEAIAASMGLGVIGFSQSFARRRPDILLVLGDRFEMYAAALAALPFAIPIAHIHGGEATEGAIDDALRHSMTKLSHLHFVATEAYSRRVMQLGEEAWRITVSGAPALDELETMKYLSREQLETQFGITLDPPPLLVTFHPVTLEFDEVEQQTREVLDALEAVGRPVVFTLPNADTNGRTVIRMINQYAEAHANARVVPNFGQHAYFSMMRLVPAMVGNSSSGLIEAASFGLPVVNVGNRQRGRVRGSNVIDVTNDRRKIRAAIQRACSPSFREVAKRSKNPYRPRRSASEIIVDKLATIPLDARLIVKTFHDIPMDIVAR